MFLTRLNSTGTALSYSTLIPNSTSTEITGLALDLDTSGDVYFLSPGDYGFPVTPGAFQACKGGFTDLLALQFGPAGQLKGGTYLGGSAFESPSAILAAGVGSVYVSGQTTSPDFPGLAGIPPGGTSGSVNLSFVVKILINNPQQKDGPCISPRVQNAASDNDALVSPGELVILNGYAFGPQTSASYQVGADGRVTTKLAGVRVLFDEIPAPLLSVQANQIEAIVPWEVAGAGSVNVRVEYNSTSTNTVQIDAAQSFPGVFVTNNPPRGIVGDAAVLNEDGTRNSASNPAKSGSVIAIFGTGGGLMTSVPADGSFSPLIPPYPLMTVPIQVALDGLAAAVLYAGAAPTLVSGVIQINVRLPKLGPGQSVLSITLGDVLHEVNSGWSYIWIE
jgi:uncharacterized protein (TIGR03437 family)